MRQLFVRQWTPEQLKAAWAAVQQHGYESTAEALGLTVNALQKRLTYAGLRPKRVRTRRADRERAARVECATVNTPKAAAPKDYAARLEERAERSRLLDLEKDNHTLKQAVEAMGALTSSPLLPVKRYEFGSGLREACAVGLLSDVHCEEEVRPGETPVANEYNPEIAERSIARFFAGYRWLMDFNRTAFKITDAVVWLGGDLMSGHIHEELKETTSGTAIETLLWLKPRLVAGIDLLLADPKLERLHVPCSYGNHGRNTIKPYRARGAAHSYEWLLYQFLADHYKEDPRVRFLADPSAHQYMRVYDWDLHFHHGDETSYQGGVGGITIPLNKAVGQWDIARKCHYHHFGHWHQYIDTGRVTVNGSVIGFNAYAMSIKATPEPPQQAFYLLDSKRGKTCKSPIWVREGACGGAR